MKIGLVLSGGMGKGAYQIGALSAISEFFKPNQFESVSAASIGALNAYAFLTDSFEVAKTIWEGVNKLNDGRFITAVAKTEFLNNCIEKIITTKHLATKLYIPLLDISNRDIGYYDLSKVQDNYLNKYLKASVSLPCYTKGIIIDDKRLYDGAVVDNIPIFPILQDDPDIIICLYFDNVHYIFEKDSIDYKIIKLTFPDETRLSHSIYVTHDSIINMIQGGYVYTKNALEYIFENGYEDLECIYRKIKERNTQFMDAKMRVTGDVVVTNINRVFQRLLKQKTVY